MALPGSLSTFRKVDSTLSLLWLLTAFQSSQSFFSIKALAPLSFCCPLLHPLLLHILSAPACLSQELSHCPLVAIGATARATARAAASAGTADASSKRLLPHLPSIYSPGLSLCVIENKTHNLKLARKGYSGHSSSGPCITAAEEDTLIQKVNPTASSQTKNGDVANVFAPVTAQSFMPMEPADLDQWQPSCWATRGCIALWPR